MASQVSGGASFDSCIWKDIGSFFSTDGASSSFSFLNNNCTGLNASVVWAIAFGSPWLVGTFYLRCPALNDVILSGTAGVAPGGWTTLTSTACETCSFFADCFPAKTLFVGGGCTRAVDLPKSEVQGEAVCQCQPTGRENMCLPVVIGAYAPAPPVCSFRDVVITTNASVDSRCSSVTLTNVTFEGVALMLNISIAAMIAANHSATKILVLLQDCTLLSNFGIVVDATGVAGLLLASASALQQVSILFDGLTGAGLMITGAFPPQTSLVISNSIMISSDEAGGNLAPSFPGHGAVYSGDSKSLFLVKSFFTQNSTFVIVNTSLGFKSTPLHTNGWSMYVVGALRIENGSSFVINATSMSSGGYGGVAFFDFLDLSVANRSSFKLINVAASNPDGEVIHFELCSLKIADSSDFSVQNSTFSGSGRAWMLYGSSFVVQQLSLLMFNSTSFVSSGGNSALQFGSSATVTIQDASVWSVSQCNFRGTEAAITIQSQATFLRVGLLSKAIISMNMLWSATLSTGCVTADMGVSFSVADSTGSIAFLNNDCFTNHGPLWSRVDLNGSFPGTLTQRCNRLNGSQSTSGLPMGYMNVTNQACGSCDLNADCFAPLTTPGSVTCSRSSLTSEPSCPCRTGTISGACLPGTATVINSTCLMTDTTLSSSSGLDVTIDPMCSDVVLLRVRWNSFALVLDVAKMAAYNPYPWKKNGGGGAGWIRVSIVDSLVENSGKLFIRGAASLPAGGWGNGSTTPLVSVFINSTTFVYSQLAFTGTFPPFTSILVSAMKLLVSNSAASVSIGLNLTSLSMTLNSSLIIAHSTLNSTIAFIGAPAPAFLASGNTVFANASSLVLTNNNHSSVVSASIKFDTGSISFLSYSTWIMNVSSFSSGTDRGLSINAYSILAVDHSAIIWAGLEISTTSPVYAAVDIFQSPITLQSLSVWVISSTRISARAGSGMNMTASRVQVTSRSVWLVAGNSIITEDSSGKNPPLAFRMPGAVAVEQQSWFALLRNNFSTPAGGDGRGSCCISFPSSSLMATFNLTVKLSSTFSFLNNNCSTGSTAPSSAPNNSFWSAIDRPVVLVDSAGTIIQRCNIFNGAVSTTGMLTPYRNTTDASCGSCDAGADCFAPLTMAGSLCRNVASVSDPAASACLCLPGGNDGTCLPVSVLPQSSSSSLPPISPNGSLTTPIISPCQLNGVSLLQSRSYIVDPSCTTVQYQAVTISANTSLNYSLAAVILANPNATVVFADFGLPVLQTGAILVVDGISALSPQAAMMLANPRISVTIWVSFLRSTNGALVIRGMFPLVTTIIISSPHMEIEPGLQGPMLTGLIGTFASAAGKAIYLRDITLLANSSMSIDGAVVTGQPGSLLTHLILVEGFLIAKNGSSFLLSGASLQSLSQAGGIILYIFHAPVVISQRSVWNVSSCSFYTNASMSAVIMETSPLTVQAWSVWTMNDCVLEGHDVSDKNLINIGWISNVLIDSNSQFIFQNDSFVVQQRTGAAWALGSNIVISNNSLWHFSQCNFEANTAISAAFLVTSLSVVVASRSAWYMSQCSTSCNNGNDAFGISGSACTISNESVWMVEMSIFNGVSTGLNVFGAVLTIADNSSFILTANFFNATTPISFTQFMGAGLIAVRNRSVILWTKNQLISSSTIVGSSCICQFGGFTFTNSTTGYDTTSYMSFLDNNCSTVVVGGQGGSIWCSATASRPIAGNGSNMVQRCNRYNGDVTVASMPHPYTNTTTNSTAMCGSCDARADCFAPLTWTTNGTCNNSKIVRFSGGTDEAIVSCPCMSAGYGSFCLPMKLPNLLGLADQPSPSAALLNCTLVNIGLMPSLFAGQDLFAFSPSCTNITLVNVDVRASTILINLTTIVEHLLQTSSSSSSTIVVTLRQVNLSLGAVIAIDATNCLELIEDSSTSLFGVVEDVSIVLTGLVGTDSGILITGSFPRRTSIIFENSALNVSVGNVLTISDVSLAVNSSLVVQYVRLNVISSQDSAPAGAIHFSGSLLLANNSRLVINAVDVAFFGANNPSIYFLMCSVGIENESAFIIRNSSFYSTNTSLMMFGSSVVLNGSSWWIMDSVYLRGVTSDLIHGAHAFMIYRSSVAVDRLSTWIINGSTIDGGQIGCGLQVSESAIWMNHSSAWVMQSNIIGSEIRGPGAFATAVIGVDENSAWIMSGVTWMSTALAITTGLSFFATSLFILGGSWMMWSELLIAVPESTTSCIVSDRIFISGKGSYMAVVDNKCDGGQYFVEAPTPVGVENGGDGLLQRCNKVGGVLSLNHFFAPYRNTSASATCGSCETGVDCFAPLTRQQSGSICTLPAAASCPCQSHMTGRAGMWCLPATLAVHRASTITSANSRSLSSSEFSGSLSTLSVTDDSGSATSSFSRQFKSKSLTISETATASCGLAKQLFGTVFLRPLVDASDEVVSDVVEGESLALAAVIGVGGVLVQAEVSPHAELTNPTNASTTVGVIVNISIITVISTPAPSSSSLVQQNAHRILMRIKLAGKYVSLLSLVKDVPLVVSFDVGARGPCIPAGFAETVTFRWTLSAMPPKTPVQTATIAAFRTTTAGSSMLGNPIAAMSTTSMISILSLDECIFSDVDPLDPSVSPSGEAVLPEMGQYYRGGAIVGITLYAGISTLALLTAFALTMLNDTEDSRARVILSDRLKLRLALLRFPSLGMVVVGLFNQGLATMSVSLLRLSVNGWDVMLAAACLAVSTWFVVGAALATAGRGFPCKLRRVKERPEYPKPLRRFMELAVWDLHWVDKSSSFFKQRYFLLIDDLSLPWWTAVELGSGLLQGIVLGIRANSLSVCRGQQWCLFVICGLLFFASAYFRPCGAVFSNMFLVSSKFAAFLVAILILIHSMTTNDSLATAALAVTSLSTLVSSIQTCVQVFAGLVAAAPVLSRLSIASARRAVVAWLSMKSIREAILIRRDDDDTPSAIAPTNLVADDDELDTTEVEAGELNLVSNSLRGRGASSRAEQQRPEHFISTPIWNDAGRLEEYTRLIHMRKIVALLIAATEDNPILPRDVRLRLVVEAACFAAAGPSSHSEGGHFPRRSASLWAGGKKKAEEGALSVNDN